MEEILIGLAIDVSGSMQTSMKNSSAQTTRFDEILSALDRYIQQTKEGKTIDLHAQETTSLFAYLFGFMGGEIADFFGTVDRFNHPHLRKIGYGKTAFKEIDELARRHRRWAGGEKFLEKQMKENEAEIILWLCEQDREFLDYILQILPRAENAERLEANMIEQLNQSIENNNSVQKGNIVEKVEEKAIKWLQKKMAKGIAKGISAPLREAEYRSNAVAQKEDLEKLEKDLRAKLASGEIHQKLWPALLPKVSPMTLTLRELIDFWQASFQQSRGDLEKVIFSSTPMCQVLQAIEKRFVELQQKKSLAKLTKILCLVSDGLPTDGDPFPIVQQLHKEHHVQVVACYITNHDATMPKTIFEDESPDWDEGARRMFALASSVTIDPIYKDYLVSQGWTVPPQGKLFFQLNRSDTLESILHMMATPREKYRDRHEND